MSDDVGRSSDELVPSHALAASVARISITEGWEAAAAFIERHWDLYVTTQPADLLDAFSALPGEAMVKRPALVSGAGYLQQIIAGLDPGRFRDSTFDDPSRPATSGGAYDQLVALTSRSSSHRTAGRLAVARERAAEGRDILERLDDRERTRLRDTLPHLLVQWGLSFQFADAGGERMFEESYELAVLTHQPAAARRAAAALAWLYADHGDLNRAEAWIQRAQRVESLNPRYDAPLHLAIAMLAHDRLETERSAELLAVFDSIPAGEYWAALLWVEAWTARTPAEAIRVAHHVDVELARQPEGLANEGANRRYLVAARARLNTLQSLPIEMPTRDEPGFFDLVMLAAAAYTRGDASDTLRFATAASRSQQPRLQASAYLLVAAARSQLKGRDAAVEAFRRAHTVIETERLHATYTSIAPAHLAALFELSALETSPAVRATSRIGPEDAALAEMRAALTTRERHVLTLLARGRTGTEISRELYISANTVKTISRHLYRKLGIHSRAEAAAIAFRIGLS